MNNLIQATIPAAGEKNKLKLSGKSIMFFSGGFGWDNMSEAATFTFDNQGIHFPAFQGNKFNYSECGFSEITIHGTAATAGGTLILQALPNCVESSVNFNSGIDEAVSGNTFIKDWTGQSNTVKQFTELELMNADDVLPKSIYIEARNADIIYRSNDGNGTNPAETAATNSFLLPSDTGDQREIIGIDFILDARFINAVAAEEPKLIVWPRY